MKKGLINLFFIILLVWTLSSCNLGFFFKKIFVDNTIGNITVSKNLAKFENENHYLHIRENKTTGCKIRMINIGSDTVRFQNINLTDGLSFLLKKRDKIVQVSNLYDDPKIDLLFVAKNEHEIENNIDTLLYLMGNIFEFEMAQQEIIYEWKVVDSVKSNKFICKKKGRPITAVRSGNVVFSNASVNYIIGMINYRYDIFIDHRDKNENRFNMALPKDFNQLKIDLLDKYGVDLVPFSADERYVRLEFTAKQ